MLLERGQWDRKDTVDLERQALQILAGCVCKYICLLFNKKTNRIKQLLL